MHHCDVPFHDSQLIGLRCIEPRVMRLSFVLVNQEKVDLLVHDIVAFRCDNFREGNIVFQVEEPPMAHIEAEEVSHLLQIPDPSHHHVETLVNRITTGELLYLRVEGSYGAEITAACGNVEAMVTE